MRIQNNITAVNSHRQYNINVGDTGKTMEKLSSGYRVNRAADDAAGLAISEKMRTQIRGLSRASLNVQDGTSLLQVAEGALQISHNILQRMRELAAQAANGTNDDAVDREALDLEYQQLIKELDQVADTTNFNGVYPLKGAAIANPRNSSLTGTGISPSQLPAAGYPVDDSAPLTPVPTPIGGTSLSLSTPGKYSINAADLAGVSTLNLGTGVTLVVNGPPDVTGPLNFYGNGSAKINGGVSGSVTVGPTNRVQVTGNIGGTVTNYGEMTIGGPGVPSISFWGDITNEGKMHITHNNAWVSQNTGSLRFETATGASLIDNQGLVEVFNNSTITGMLGNNAGGRILVGNGCSIGGGGNYNANNAIVEVADGGTATIESNHGNIYCIGIVGVGDNFGYLEVGKWDGDAGTPVGGSIEGWADVADNKAGGIIRNFSQDMTVHTNNGTIDNYGTITDASGGVIRHHARGLDASSVVFNTTDALQNVFYTANGKPQSISAAWKPVTGGFELIFDTPASFDNGTVILSANASLRKDGMQYGIQNPVTIPDSIGTFGRQLKYFIADPFIIQSGANEGDVTLLGFRALNAMYLGTELEGDANHEHVFENIGESNILTMENASCCLSLTLKAINDISIYRAELGAQYNRLEYTYANLGVSVENLGAAESRIRDTDMAKQMTIFTTNNILVQSSTAMLAQANALPQGVLQLLG